MEHHQYIMEPHGTLIKHYGSFMEPHRNFIKYIKHMIISIRYRKTHVNLYWVQKNVQQSLLGTEKRMVISIRYRKTYSNLYLVQKNVQ